MEQLVVAHPDNDRYHFTLGALYDEAQATRDSSRSSTCSAPSSSTRTTRRRSTTSATRTPSRASSLDEAESAHPPRARDQPATTASISTASAGSTTSAATTTRRSSISSAPSRSPADDPTIAEHLGDAYQQAGRTTRRAAHLSRRAQPRDRAGADRTAARQDRRPAARRIQTGSVLRMRRAAIAVLADRGGRCAGCTAALPAPSPPAARRARACRRRSDRRRRSRAPRATALRSVRARWRGSATSRPRSRAAPSSCSIAERPDRLRFEILSPFGAVFVLTAADGALAAWARSESTVYRGSALAPRTCSAMRRSTCRSPRAVDLLCSARRRWHGDATASCRQTTAAIELWQDGGDAACRSCWFERRRSSRCATSSATADGQRAAARDASASTPPSTACACRRSSASSCRRASAASTSRSARPEVNPALAERRLRPRNPGRQQESSTWIDLRNRLPQVTQGSDAPCAGSTCLARIFA